jgi:tetratricopeptide (TPR) repeat protein
VRAPVPLVDFARRGPLVSRRAELELLRERWGQVVGGQRRVVLLGGEAGVGKTRLVAELAGLAADDALLLVGHCDHRALAAYQPIVEALRTCPEAVEAVRAAGGSLGGRVPALLGDPPPPSAGSAAGVGRWLESDPDEERFALFDGVTRLLARLAADRPVLFVVEDLERVDHASSLLLHHLARGLPARVLLVLTFRDPPGSEHPPLRELLAGVERRGGADRLMLPVLDEAELAVLVSAVTGGEPPASFVRSLWRRTGGNPFYAGEVVRYLGVDRRLGAGSEHGAGRGVPASVRDVLRGRLHELPEAARHLLGCAALVGGEVDAALLEAVAGLPEDRLVDAVQQATRSGLLVEVGCSGSAAYALSHALVREAVYADIPVPRRRRLHLRAARALVGSGRGADLAVAAVHLRAAGPLADLGEAAELSLRAADAAHLLYAWDEAAAHAEAALELLEAGGAPLARRAVVAERAGMLRWYASAEFGKALDSLATALDLYRGLGDERSAARVHSRLGVALATHATAMDIPRALEHLQAAAAVLTDGAGAWHVENGTAYAAAQGLQTERLGRAAHAGLAIADQLARKDFWGWSACALAYYRFNRGELAAMRGLHEQVWDAARDIGDPYLGWVVVAAQRGLFSVLFLADPRPAEQWCRRGLALRRLDALPRQRGDLLDWLGIAVGLQGRLPAARELARDLGPGSATARLVTLWDGRWEDAEASFAAALRAYEDAGNLFSAAVAAAWLAVPRHLLGRHAEAADVLQRALTWAADGLQVPAELLLRVELVRILADAGETGEAAAHLARCEEILATGEDWRGRVGDIELARGALAAATGQPDRAAAAYAAAVGIFQAYHLPWRQALALQAAGQALAAAGRATEAAASLEAGHQVYRRLGAPPRWHQHMDAAARRTVPGRLAPASSAGRG